jgi:hypothetical protein
VIFLCEREKCSVKEEGEMRGPGVPGPMLQIDSAKIVYEFNLKCFLYALLLI